MSESLARPDAGLTTEAVPLSPGAAPTIVRVRGARFGATSLTVRRAVRMFALVAIAGASLETTVRVEDWLVSRTPFWSRIRSEEDLIVRDRLGMHGRANARFGKWEMNALGMRGPRVPARASRGTVRVVTLGASETFGLYESPGREFPRQLEDTLNSRAAAGACGARGEQGARGAHRFEVLNAALPGMSLPTVEQDVRLRLSRAGLDIALYYPTPVQYLENRAPVASHPDSAPGAGRLPATRSLYPRSLERIRDEAKRLLPARALAYLRRREAAAVVRAHPPGWRYDAVPADRLALYERDLRRLVGTVRATGATPVLATHADELMRDARDRRQLLSAWERFYPRATGRAIVGFDAEARGATLRVARDSGVAIADVAGVLGRADGIGAGEAEPFADFVHFTDHGAARAAGAMADAVLAAARERGVCGRAAAVARR